MGDDPNAENPDRDRWVDLASVPFRPELVGGRVVQLRSVLATSLNAVTRPAGSTDVERIHKFLLGAPLLMEVPDRGPAGFEVMPWAALSLPEDSPDHLTQVWTLRPDVTWEDGKPVTAKDYAFTMRMIKDPGVASSLANAYRLVESIEEIDAQRFRVKWSGLNNRAIFAIGLDLQVVPAHAMPGDAASFAKTTTHLACGPYRVAAFSPSKIELALRDEYRTKPFPIRPNYVERFVYEGGVQDQLAALTRLINGEAHIVGLRGDQYANQATEPAFRAAAWRTHFFMPSFSFIAWNLNDPADPARPHPDLGDVRVRRALSHLVPVEAIAAGAFLGLARPVSGPFDFRDPGYDARIAPFEHDPAKAAALLKEAGFLPGPDGRLARNGRPIAFTLARFGPALLTVAQAFQEEARKAGIEIALEDRGRDFSSVTGHKFDAALILWQMDPIDPDVSGQWHSRNARAEGNNYSGFADAETDQLLDRHEKSFDPKERAALRRRVHARLHDEIPCTFLFANPTMVGISRKFANVKIHDLGVRFHDMVLRELWEKK
jgi:peptide/nickel transport system substrate-binding protein